MANDENLIPFSERTESELREFTKKGGKNSGVARRRKRDIKAKMKLLLSLPASDNDKKQLAAMGIDSDDMDNEMVLVKALFLSAADGDVKAFDRIMDVLGKSVQREDLELRKKALKQKSTQSTGKSEKLIQSLLEVKENDIHEETTGADDAMEEAET